MAERALRVLVLEDNVADERLMLAELRASGLAVESQRVCTEAEYRGALRDDIDVILADFTLPDFDAKRALEILRELRLRIPFIIVTGTIGEETAVACMRAGATDYLLKDRLARLADAIRRAVDERRASEEKERADTALTERLRFEALFAQVSARLINTPPGELDAAIVEVLRNVAESQGFDRALVQLLDESREYFRQSHEWCAPGVPSFTVSLSGRPISEFGWPLDALRKGEAAILRRGKLPGTAVMARSVMDRDGLVLLAFLPLSVESEVIGIVGFHQREGRRPVGEDLLGRLTLVSEVVANALARKRSEERRKAAYDELARLKKAAEEERDYLREELAGDTAASGIVGTSPAISAVLELVSAVATTKATVLIRGESGVGKELIARAIHSRSTRASRPLVKVNCASIPKELFESEFFGHVKGSFTGAHKDRVGRFELADRGTIFLDEVGELPLDMQAKLLRILQESEFERVGDDRTRRVDVRVIAATNRDLEADSAEGRFRADLYYRLSVFPIEVPPLRARREDILPLAEHFLKKSARDLGRPALSLSDEQRATLGAYDWPGNIRELQHVIERAVILTRSPPLRLDLGSLGAAPRPASGERPILTEVELKALETENLRNALERAGWRVTGTGGAAELLGVRPSTLRDRMKALGIQRAE
ncbi:MAG TPA: sigma 54-interacting transcriptional regulator [Polyangiaceae bacterium]|nr:sigma 54-interacting transcriptional regulator [Polyangiaceae bacterium]